MFRHNIPAITIGKIRKKFIDDPKFNKSRLGRGLHISKTTVNAYGTELQTIKAFYPNKLKDFEFFLPVSLPGRPKKEIYQELCSVLPALIQQQKGPRLKVVEMWQAYKISYPEGYSYTPFKDHFFKRCAANDIRLVSTNRIGGLTDEQKETLRHWCLSNDNQRWQIAVVLEAAHTRKSLLKTMEKVECCFKTVLRWIAIFNEKGLDGFQHTYTVNKKVADAAQLKTDNPIHLLRQSPKIYGLQRTSWTTILLAEVYNQEYGSSMSQASVSQYLRRAGIYFRHAKEVLTSPDPAYRRNMQPSSTSSKT
jgi:transposase